MSYLLDTNIVTAILKNNERVKKNYARCVGKDKKYL